MKKKSWDDIPSLEGVSMDWDYTPETARDKRAALRISASALARLFGVKEVPARIAAEGQTYTMTIRNLSEGGMAMHVPVVLPAGLVVTVGFFLGRRKVITKARVCHVQKPGNLTGFAFLQLGKETVSFIRGLYPSLVLNNMV
ncbi:MAG: PilZ domain-containing protein [Desulfobulbus sp.]|nr:PilZ domain-containing protein [Desulfobulbus sp.]